MTLDLYMFRRFLAPYLFVLSLLAILFVAIEVSGGLVRLLSEPGSSHLILLVNVVNRMPWWLVFTSPLAVLLAGLLVFGSMSEEGEIVALKAAGAGLHRIVFPVLVCCTLLAGLSLWTNEGVVPACLRRANDLWRSMGLGSSQTIGAWLRPVRLSDDLEQHVYARSMDQETHSIEGLVIMHFRQGRVVREINATEASYHPPFWVLHHVRDTKRSVGGSILGETCADNLWLPLGEDGLPSSIEFRSRKLRPEEMSRQEIRAELEDRDEAPSKLRYRARLELVLGQRVALPVSSIIFGLIAIPLGLRAQKSRTWSGLGVALLFVLLYYVLMTVSSTAAERQSIPPLLAAWVPNVVFAAIGTYLYRRVAVT